MMGIMDSSVSTIARRLTFMNVMVSGTALLLACLAFLAYDQFSVTEVLLVRTVLADGKPVGTVCIRSDLSALERRLVRYGLISVVVIALSLLAALLVSRSFRKSVADPIVHLAEVATQVSREK